MVPRTLRTPLPPKPPPGREEQRNEKWAANSLHLGGLMPVAMANLSNPTSCCRIQRGLTATKKSRPASTQTEREPHTQEKLVRDVLNITSPACSNLSHTRGRRRRTPPRTSNGLRNKHPTCQARRKRAKRAQTRRRRETLRVWNSAHVQLCCKSRAVGTHYNVLLF